MKTFSRSRAAKPDVEVTVLGVEIRAQVWRLGGYCKDLRFSARRFAGIWNLATEA